MSHLINGEQNKDLPMLVSGKGVFLYDNTGKEYIDGSSGVMLSNLGHGHDEISHALYDQAKNLAFSYRSQFRNFPAERLAKTLIDLSKDKSQAMFFNSGSEAVDAAIRIALQYFESIDMPSKKQVIGRDISNHGNTIASLSIAQNQRRDEIDAITLDIGEHKLPSCYCYRCPYQKDPKTCALECAEALEEKINALGAENVAVFIAEPTTATAGGVLFPHEDYFSKIREICDRHQILFIADEIVSGLGRTGDWFLMHRYGVSSDITVVGKGLNAGYASLSAVLISDTIERSLADKNLAVSVGHSHSNNPLACTVGEAVIKILKRDNVLQGVQEKSKLLQSELLDVKSQFDFIGDVRVIGLLAGIELVQNRTTKASFSKDFDLSKTLTRIALDEGLVIYTCRGLQPDESGDAILIAPPLIISEQELAELISRFITALKQLQLHIASIDQRVSQAREPACELDAGDV